jgi:hypothetical protein
MPTMSTRLPAASSVPRHDGTPVKGLPRMNYYLPVIVTFLASVFSFLLVALLMMFAIFNVMTQVGRMGAGDQGVSWLTTAFCGVVALICAIGTIYFFIAVIKGFRDIFTPIYYTRGTVADKRVLGGRRSGTWLGVIPRYTGPDLAEASLITEEQRFAYPDRSQVFEPRYNPKKPEPTPAPRPGSGYLPVDRISASRNIDPADLPLRVIFRVDPISHTVLEPDEEVLLAHTRYLQHIFYVAHIKAGDWESYPNKALI